MVSNNGLRIERLLYFGFLLIFACWFELYLVEATAYFSNPQNRSLDTLIAVIEKERNNLKSAFDEQQKTVAPKNAKDLAVAEMREKLGLAPQRNKSSAIGSESYHDKLSKILSDIYIQERGTEELNGRLDSKKPPEQLIDELRALRSSSQKNSATVFGIETPRLLSFQYGSSDFKIPSQFLATVLLVAIQPIAMIWIGSFYITRQRELMAIRQYRDHKQTFPHILNWFAIDFSAFYARIGFLQTRKQQRAAIVTTVAFTTAFRCLIVLVIALLIVTPVTYSTISLSTIPSTPLPITVTASAFTVINFILGLMLFVQEAVSLRGKVFYE